ncbi:MAG: IS3 family transposase [Chitinophagaceae bacterium]
MNQVFRYIGYSKQAFHQKMARKLKEQEQSLLLLPIIAEMRREHPGVAARQLYLILKPENTGRDKFESFCFEHGFKLERPKAYRRTTDSTGVIRFPNLIAGIEFRGINQVWSSDITYYQIGEVFYYLTFIIDLFSRKIVGYSVSKRLLTEQTTIPALQMALNERSPAPGLILHSDGGGQYYCKAFLKLTEDYKIKNSMCDMVYENSHAERLNGTIKNQYLKGYNPQSYAVLIEMTKRSVTNYNSVRPHQSLKKIPPAAFETLLPAGGSSLTNNDFCICGNSIELHQKNHHLSKRAISTIKDLKTVEKTVNVF